MGKKDKDKVKEKNKQVQKEDSEKIADSQPVNFPFSIFHFPLDFFYLSIFKL